MMFEQLGMMKHIIKSIRRKEVIERMAECVMNDLKEEGFEPKFVKPGRSYKTYRIVPVNTLKPEEQERFDKIKKESTDEWREVERENLTQIKASLTGRAETLYEK